MECDITFEKPVLKDREEIARLLSSPAFYDENTHQLNFAAFFSKRQKAIMWVMLFLLQCI